MAGRPVWRLALAALWGAAILWLMSGTARMPVQEWVPALLVAAPVWLTVAALSAIRAGHARAQFVTPGRHGLPGLLHLGRLMLAAPAALIAGGGVVAWVLTEPRAPVLAGIAGIAALAMALLADRAWGPARRPFARPRPALWGGMIVGPAVAAVCAILPGPGDAVVTPANYREAIAARPTHDGPSHLLGWLVDFRAVIDGFFDALGLPVWFGLPVVTLFATLPIATAAVAFVLPRPAVARILSPTDADRPVASPMAIALATALGLILTVTGLQTLATLEAATGRAPVVSAEAPEPALPPHTGKPGPGQPPGGSTGPPPPRGPLIDLVNPSTLRQVIEQDRIGMYLCPPGTIAGIERDDARFAGLLDSHRTAARAAIIGGFDEMRANVPLFLDGYYSLSAEYLRTAHVLIGDGEDYLKRRLEDHLDTEGLTRALAPALDSLAALRRNHAALLEARAERLSACSTLPSDAAVTITDSRPPDFLAPPFPEDMIAVEFRLAGSLGAGTLAGVATAKVVAKAGLSGAFRTAAATLAKLATSRAMTLGGGILIGAGGGGAVGSVIPGAGTVGGAVIGGVVGGAAVMFGVDWTLLQLEEAISRDEFRADLLAAIDLAEADLLDQYGLR